MSDDEMMAIDDEEIAPSRNKGKGKAVDTVEMDDNLPWYCTLSQKIVDDLQGGEVSTSVTR